MPRIRIPKIPGEFKVIITMANTYAVFNNKKGKNKLIIPCRDRAQAEEICKKLNNRDCKDEIWI
jgi:hypothetical protein